MAMVAPTFSLKQPRRKSFFVAENSANGRVNHVRASWAEIGDGKSSRSSQHARICFSGAFTCLARSIRFQWQAARSRVRVVRPPASKPLAQQQTGGQYGYEQTHRHRKGNP
jgi:hypothetical protein